MIDWKSTGTRASSHVRYNAAVDRDNGSVGGIAEISGLFWPKTCESFFLHRVVHLIYGMRLLRRVGVVVVVVVVAVNFWLMTGR